MISEAGFAILTILLQAAAARQAVLECTGDTWFQGSPGPEHVFDNTLRIGGGKAAVVSFRTSLIEGWPAASATLLLHVESGAPAGLRLAIVNRPWSENKIERGLLEGVHWIPVKATPYREGWIKIELPRALRDAVSRPETTGLALAGDRPIEFHSRETIQFSPYLLVTARDPN